MKTWHDGERALQETVGLAERMEQLGPRVIHNAMPAEHRAFASELPFVIAGAVDPAGDAWATILTGEPGFISSPSARELEIAAMIDANDPASAGMRDGDAIGLLGIELLSRSRIRVNGILRGGLNVDVEESFGNCPKYIHPRHVAFGRWGAAVSTAFDDAARAMIAKADTFFVATYSEHEAHRRIDVSHRGGAPGFVAVANNVLTIPDYRGNMFFSTLGNILTNEKAGLAFIDFDTGDLLQLTGNAKVHVINADSRHWTFTPRRLARRPALPVERSEHNP
jgi:predicted pyridoxine 5'-phosphate oxidase superfamily flavin-nucleotide-binding protein